VMMMLNQSAAAAAAAAVAAAAAAFSRCECKGARPRTKRRRSTNKKHRPVFDIIADEPRTVDQRLAFVSVKKNSRKLRYTFRWALITACCDLVGRRVGERGVKLKFHWTDTDTDFRDAPIV